MDRDPVAVAWLGRVGYERALGLQRQLQERRRASGQDWLLMLEHDPVFTLGRQHSIPKWRDAQSASASRIPVVLTERGGDITYHGPGQLVAYVIMDLRAAGIGATDLVWRLEEVAIATLAAWGIEAGRDARNRGAWIGNRKVAQVGISVRGGVSMHGIALNVATDPGHFALIEACGLPDIETTSMADLLGGRRLVVGAVATVFREAFGAVFGRLLVDTTAPEVPEGDGIPRKSERDDADQPVPGG